MCPPTKTTVQLSTSYAVPKRHNRPTGHRQTAGRTDNVSYQ